MDMIFRDEDLYTIEKTKYEEKYKDNGYGFYCDLESQINDINYNDIYYEREMKYNQKIVEDQMKNEAIKHFEQKYKSYADYCIFAVIVFSCSMFMFNCP